MGVISDFSGKGGKVRGPGGPRDDAVKSKLSAGEYVVPASIVAIIGTPFLDSMVAAFRRVATKAAKGRAGYADGGLVGSDAPAGDPWHDAVSGFYRGVTVDLPNLVRTAFPSVGDFASGVRQGATQDLPRAASTAMQVGPTPSPSASPSGGGNDLVNGFKQGITDWSRFSPIATSASATAPQPPNPASGGFLAGVQQGVSRDLPRAAATATGISSATPSTQPGGGFLDGLKRGVEDLPRAVGNVARGFRGY